ncbi:MAG: hypothetical protein QXK37_01535 [Candidatus Woesearchaeota archaeon]
MKGVRSQFAIEYVVIVSFALLALIPLLFIYGSEKSAVEMRVNANQAHLLARKIVDSAETVYYLGEPSKTTLKVYMPKNIDAIIITEKELVFRMKWQGETTDITQQSQVNLSGSLSPHAGIRYISITATDTGVIIDD